MSSCAEVTRYGFGGPWLSDRCGVTLDMTVLWQLVANKADRCACKGAWRSDTEGGKTLNTCDPLYLVYQEVVKILMVE